MMLEITLDVWTVLLLARKDVQSLVILLVVLGLVQTLVQVDVLRLVLLLAEHRETVAVFAREDALQRFIFGVQDAEQVVMDTVALLVVLLVAVVAQVPVMLLAQMTVIVPVPQLAVMLPVILPVLIVATIVVMLLANLPVAVLLEKE